MSEQREPGVAAREPQLLGQLVVVIGGSSGIGLATAQHARAEGADVVLTGRNPDRLQKAALELGAVGSAAFDVTEPGRLEEFFQGLPAQVDHVMVTAGGSYYAALADIDLVEAQRNFDEHVWLPIRIARAAVGKVREGGTLVFMNGTGGKRPGVGMTVVGTVTAALPALTANLALELAPIRVNLIAAGFVDTPLSASLLGDELDSRREELRTKLPIRRVVGPDDVAALAVHLMTNSALTGATYDVDGGQQIVSW